MDGAELHSALLDRLVELRAEDMDDGACMMVLREEFGHHAEFEAKLPLALGISTPPPAVVPRDADPWFSVESTHTFWPAYLDFLQDPHRGDFPDNAIASIHASTNKIMNRIANPLEFHKPAYGMVVGHVQSGKTANFTGLIAKAADAGYNLFVVLSGGNFNDLRMQTQLRLSQQLTGQAGHQEGKIIDTSSFTTPWFQATQPDEWRGSGEVGAENWKPDWDDRSSPCLVVTKKNVDSLKKLRDWAVHLSNKEDIKLLLIDDEADHASINISDDASGSAINLALRELLDLFSTYSFIGYTATPFANVFIHPESDGVVSQHSGRTLRTLYPSDFILALPEPEGYLGLATMFPEDDWSHWTCEVSEEDADWARKQVDHGTPTQELGVGLNNAVLDFLLTWALRSRRNGSLEFHHTMMIHTKETKKSMKPWITRVNNRLASMQSAIFEGRVWAMEHGQKLLDELEERYDSEFVQKWDPSRGTAPSIDDVFAQLKLLMSHRRKENLQWPDVANISSEEADEEAGEKGGEDLDYHLHPKGRVVIAVGGNRLARGFTLEGLCVSYFIRHPSQLKSDTLLQQGRWFGHRHAYKDLVRLHTTPSLRANFHGLLKVETYLRDRLELMEERGDSPLDFAIPVLKALDMVPTAPNKMPNPKRLKTVDFSGDFLPSTMRAPLTKPAQLKHNLKVTAEFLNELGEPGAKKLGRRIWKRAVPADRVLDLLSTLKYPKDPYKTKELKAYLERRRKAGRGEIETWSVALIGLNKGTKSRPFESYGCSHDLVMQARSKDIGSPDKIGTAHGPNDFFLDLPGKEVDYRPGGTWSVRLLAKARASDNPLLTLYVFDPDAEAPKGRERLFPNGSGVPVVVPAMIFPLAKIPESERKAQSNEFWSNEALPTLEGKA